MTATTTTAPDWKLVIVQIAREFDIVTDLRREHLAAMTAAANTGKLIAPTRIEDLNRANTEFAEWRRATDTLKRMLADGVTPPTPSPA